jgi:hypothetical protein
LTEPYPPKRWAGAPPGDGRRSIVAVSDFTPASCATNDDSGIEDARRQRRQHQDLSVTTKRRDPFTIGYFAHRARRACNKRNSARKACRRHDSSRPVTWSLNTSRTQPLPRACARRGLASSSRGASTARGRCSSSTTSTCCRASPYPWPKGLYLLRRWPAVCRSQPNHGAFPGSSGGPAAACSLGRRPR